MIFEKKSIHDNEGYVIAEVPFPGNSAIYDCSFSVCPNPSCRCLTLSITLNLKTIPDSNLDAPENVTFKIDFAEKKLLEIGENTDESFVKKLLELMDDDDYALLGLTHFSLKHEHVKNAPLCDFDLDFADISGGYEGIDSGLMVEYENAFPFSEELYLQINGQRCLGIHSFCLKRSCNCTDCIVHINTLEKPASYAHVTVNYQTQRLHDLDQHEWILGPLSPESLKENFIATKPDFFQSLKSKHQRLRKLYRLSRKEFHKPASSFDVLAPIKFSETPSISKNAPCPCGSGKKYKKCCMK